MFVYIFILVLLLCLVGLKEKCFFFFSERMCNLGKVGSEFLVIECIIIKVIYKEFCK